MADKDNCPLPLPEGGQAHYLPSPRCVIPRVASKEPLTIEQQLGPSIRPPKKDPNLFAPYGGVEVKPAADFPASTNEYVTIAGTLVPEVAVDVTHPTTYPDIGCGGIHVGDDVTRADRRLARAVALVERHVVRAASHFNGRAPFTPEGKRRARKAVRLYMKALELEAARRTRVG